MSCVLCGADAVILYTDYWHCTGACGLVFLDPSKRLSAAEERARYDLHNNDPEDSGYQHFLRRLTDVLIPHLTPGARGLDFGCGPGPALSQLMNAAGFPTENYDPYYFDDERFLQQRYNFITATEVFEHIYDPVSTLKQLSSMIHTGGILAVMTEMLISPERFEQWWYHSDPTHVTFYSKQTFNWIAEQYKWRVEFPRQNVVLYYT